MSRIEGRRILVGVTGGIAAYKTAALVSLLVQQSAEVSVVMTQAAHHFIGATTFAALTGRAVSDSVFDVTHPLGAHIELARRGELLCIAPASADFLGKAAHGLADDLLSTLYLCFRGPTVIAPAMNCEMWDHPAVQRNVRQLRDDGAVLVGPEEGWLSCRDRGSGRMSEPAVLAEAIGQTLRSQNDIGSASNG